MKYHILCIAPYETLAATMRSLTLDRSDLDMDIFVGDLSQGVQIVKEHEHSGYDVIISRGGTAQEIRRYTDIPVIEIELSVYDILRAIRLADNYDSSFAIVGFESITRQAHLLSNLLQYDFQIITITSSSEAVEALNALMEQGINMVLCDTTTQSAARIMNMNSINITSGTESIISTLDQAIAICHGYHRVQEENHFLRNILQDQDSNTIVMSESGQVFLSTWADESADNVHNILRHDLSGTISNGGGKFFHTINNTLYSIQARISFYKDKKYVIYYISTSKIPLSAGRYGLHFYNKDVIKQEYMNSFFSMSGALARMSETLDEIADGTMPVLILSEEGTGKNQIANYIYIKDEHPSKPFVKIDCNVINDRNWEYLLNNYNSPFNDNDNVICFINLERLPIERHRKLLAFMRDSELARRNRLILCATQSTNDEINTFMMSYMNELNCFYLRLPNLRQRIDELPMLATLYLNHLNQEFRKQLLGFEPGAIRIMQSYEWPNNFIQFRRVLRAAATLTEGSYISADTVATLIANEKVVSIYHSMKDPASETTNLPFSAPKLTLNEMMLRLVEQILHENGGNQSKTARQLGISRTTLWRYLGNENK